MAEHPHEVNTRLRWAIAAAGAAFVVGAIIGAGSGSSAQVTLAERYAAEWARHEWPAMWRQLSAEARRSYPLTTFERAYRQDAATATATRIAAAGTASEAGSTVTLPMRVKTRIFGTLRLPAALPTGEENGAAVVLWRPYLAFPGVRAGETLTRTTRLPPRATLLARDGSVLAEGAATEPASRSAAEVARSSPLGPGAYAAVGGVGPIPSGEAERLQAQGVPPNALVGVSGLERILDARLRGTPGGTLLAGRRVLANSAPRAAAPVRSSISPQVQTAAVEALGGVYGGIVALQPRTGQILAVSGIGLEGLQPPGSTFKIVTASAALEGGDATLRSTYPDASYATLDGVKLENANGEVCGGTLIESFATSCNSVFAPLGVKVGAPALVATAEHFGFNHPPGVAGAAESTLPAASSIQGELELGSTAIGQGEVQATALQMGVAAATIGERGRRPRPTFALGAPAVFSNAIRAHVAAEVRTMMIAVVRSGTGTAAAIPGVIVAGKTGTAEIGEPCKKSEGGEEGTSEPSPACNEPPGSNTDAWFASFAPASRPRVAVGVLLVKDGSGGESAAPAARAVMEAALSAGL